MQKLLCIFALVLCSSTLRSAPDAIPDSEEIVRRLIEKSKNSETLSAAAMFAYTRVTHVFFMEDDGKVKKQVDRIYSVAPENGKPRNRLVSVNGRPIDPKNEEHKQWQTEAGENARELRIDEKLLSRYEFNLTGTDVILGRPTFILNFEPKADPDDSGGFFGKLLNELHGRVWVDQEDFQLVRADVSLRRKVNFFGGLAGKIEQMSLHCTRQRLAPDVWLNSMSSIELAGRKLFSSMRFKAFENCMDFRKVPETPQEQAINP